MTLAVDLGRKANKQTNKIKYTYPKDHPFKRQGVGIEILLWSFEQSKNDIVKFIFKIPKSLTKCIIIIIDSTGPSFILMSIYRHISLFYL